MDQAKGYKKFVRAQRDKLTYDFYEKTHIKKKNVNYMSDKRLIFRVFKRTTQLKWGKDFDSIFP